MKPKSILSIVLLVFVAAALVAAAVGDWGGRPDSSGPEANSNQPPAQTDRDRNVPLPEDRTAVYYFHGNTRCATCNKMEAYAREALDVGFAELLSDGRIEWRVVNYDEPANSHYKEDFELIAPSLVLVNIRGGTRAGFSDLNDIWSLVDEKDAFVDYVRGEVQEFLEQ